MYKKIQIVVLLSAISGLMLNTTHILSAATAFSPNVDAVPGFFAKLSTAQQDISTRLPALPNMATVTQALKENPTLAAGAILEILYAVALGGYIMHDHLKTQAKSNEIKVFARVIQDSIDITKDFEPTFASADFRKVDELAENLKTLGQLQNYYANWLAIANQIGHVKTYLERAANIEPELPEKTSLIEQTKTEANKALLLMTAHKLDTLYNFKLTDEILRILRI